MVVAHDELVEVTAAQQARAQDLGLVGDRAAVGAVEGFHSTGSRRRGLLGLEHVEDELEAFAQLLQRREDIAGEHRSAILGQLEDLIQGEGLLELGQGGRGLADQGAARSQYRGVAALQVRGQLPAARQLQGAEQDQCIDRLERGVVVDVTHQRARRHEVMELRTHGLAIADAVELLAVDEQARVPVAELRPILDGERLELVLRVHPVAGVVDRHSHRAADCP